MENQLAEANGMNGQTAMRLTIAPVRAKEDLLRQLRQAIHTGQIKAGERLMNERELADVSTLSRSTVRDVLATLERTGLIERQVGRGTYVTEQASQQIPGLEDEQATIPPADLIEFRLTIEPALADLLVLKASDAEIEAMQLHLDAGSKARIWQEVEQIDSDFHRMLYEATHNTLMIQLGQQVARMRATPVWMRLKERKFRPEDWSHFQDEHNAILDALRMRDSGKARELLRRHIAGVRVGFAL